jgi:signal peptidase I
VRVLVFVPVVLSIGLAGCSQTSTNARAVQKSMEPTIRSGEYISVDLHAYDTRDPQVGEIVSLRAPANVDAARCAVRRRPGQPCRRSVRRLTGEYLIKRIVAGPGQRIAINREGRVRVDGVLQEEPFLIACAPLDLCRLPRPITVPAGQYFVMGDNRPYSSDSRYWGPVPRAAIEGRVTPPDPARR